MRTFSPTMSDRQPGDHARAAQVSLAAVDADNPPLRLPPGPDAQRNIAKLPSVAVDIEAWTSATSFDLE